MCFDTNKLKVNPIGMATPKRKKNVSEIEIFVFYWVSEISEIHTSLDFWHLVNEHFPINKNPVFQYWNN